MIRKWTACWMIGILAMLTPTILWSQIYSDETVRLGGFTFERFVLSVSTTDRFRGHPKSQTWLTMIEKNLCWSGAFKLYQPQNRYCRVQEGTIDFQLNLELIRGITTNTLQFQLKDSDGIGLFTLQTPMAGNRLEEKIVMERVNQLTEKITGKPGILGSTLAFTFKQPGYNKLIARTSTHGEKLDGVSRTGSITISPRWSPQGNGIVYTTIGRSGSSLVYDDLIGPTKILASHRGINSGGTWFPNGKQLVITLSKDGNPELYRLSLDNLKPRRLTRHPSIDTYPAVSPDGRYLLFVSDRAGNEQIYVMHLRNDSNEISRLTFTGIRNTDPAWSPDGRWIAFTKTVARRDQIYIMDIFGENIRAITRGPYHSEQPAWSPDGRQIVFSSNRSGEFKLYIVFLDGTGLRRLTSTSKGFEEKSPSWTGRRFE